MVLVTDSKALEYLHCLSMAHEFDRFLYLLRVYGFFSLVLRNCFVTLLALLIALQSGVAIAYNYELYHSGSEHYQTNHLHQHAKDKGVFDRDVGEHSHGESSELAQNDCHQCGHCHGHSSVALVESILTISPLPFAETLVGFPPGKTKYTPISLFRPPIA